MSSSLHAERRAFAQQQRGYALLLTVIALVLASLSFLVGATSQNATRSGREDITRQSLALAKDALLARAALNVTMPGALPCPDNNNDGIMDYRFGEGCNTPGTYTGNWLVGRLPWQSLGLPDLRDGDGERLWYAISLNYTARTESRPLNGNSPGQLIVLGETPASNINGVVAIVFSPGAALPHQLRNGENIENPAAYLEAENNFSNDPGGINNGVFSMLPISPNFNDRLAIIRAPELFALVEKAVAARVADMVAYYGDEWRRATTSTRSFFPYATPALPNQPQEAFCGNAGLSPTARSEGLLPASEIPACVSLSLGPSPIQDWEGRISGETCDPIADADELEHLHVSSAVACEFDVAPSGAATYVSVSMTIHNWPRSLAMPLRSKDLRFGDDETDYVGPKLAGEPLYTLSGLDAEMKYSGEIPASPNPQHMRIVFPLVTLYSQSPTANAHEFFYDNEWYRLVYYAAVAQRMKQGSIANCTPGVSCIDVIGLAEPVNKQGVVVVAGPPRAFQTRPSATLTDYWDLENASNNDGVFQRSRRSLDFNDSIAVVP